MKWYLVYIGFGLAAGLAVAAYAGGSLWVGAVVGLVMGGIFAFADRP